MGSLLAKRMVSDPAKVHGLRLEGLTKTYGNVVAVDDVSLTIPGGEFLTLLGPSGSGKTTLLMMIAGFVAPDRGELSINGHPITATPPERRNFGMVFQGYALFPHMTAAQNIAYPLRVRGVARAVAAEKVRRAVSLVRLIGLEHRYPRELSGGQQQRVAIARAVVFSPELLLLDEPLGALDRQLRAEVQMELKALHAELGTTFVYVTHDQDEALSMSDRVAVVNRGRIEQVGTPSDLYERPRTRFVAEFLGRSNCFAASVRGVEGGLTRVEAGSLRLFHHGAIHVASPLLAIRPEKIVLGLDEPAAANRVPGRVVALAYLGATLQAVVETAPLGRLTASCLAWAAPKLAEGDRVWLSWSPEATVTLIAEP